MHATIDRFITFKVPTPIEPSMTGSTTGGMIYKTHAVMTDGQHLIISDSRYGSGWAAVDETLVFMCDESGDITNWAEVAGSRMARTEQIICDLNEWGYNRPVAACE